MDSEESAEELLQRRAKIKARRMEEEEQLVAQERAAEKRYAPLRKRFIVYQYFCLFFVIVCLIAFPYFFSYLGGLGLFLPWLIMAILLILGMGLRLYLRRLAKKIDRKD